MGPGTRFAWQHDARRRPDGTITLFDNGAEPKVETALSSSRPPARPCPETGDARP